MPFRIDIKTNICQLFLENRFVLLQRIYKIEILLKTNFEAMKIVQATFDIQRSLNPLRKLPWPIIYAFPYRYQDQNLPIVFRESPCFTPKNI